MTDANLYPAGPTSPGVQPQLQLPHIPDNLSVPQFMLDYQHVIRPVLTDLIPCLVDCKTRKSMNLSQIRCNTYGLANALSSEYAIGVEDKVMILSPNHIDYPVIVWAVHRLGGIVTCSNPQFTPDELCHQLRTANVTFMVIHSTILDIGLKAANFYGLPGDRIVLLDKPEAEKELLLNGSILERDNVPDLIEKGLNQSRCFTEYVFKPGEGKKRVALLSWSSGTTGMPKAVAISHYGLIANVIQMAVHNGVDGTCQSSSSHFPLFKPGDIALGVLPFFHVAGFVITVHLVLFCSMTLIVQPKYEFFSMLDNLIRYRVTHLFLVPPQATTLSRYPLIQDVDLGCLKYIMIGAAPVSRQVQDKLCTLFPWARIGQAYGMTEMTTTVAMLSATQQRGPLGSGGCLLPGIEARVLRPDGTNASPGEVGELVVKGPGAALGYWGNLSATRDMFFNGWVRTGDAVILTQDQEVFIFDRLKEFLKVGGFQVAPAELEGSLLGHPDVEDSCVVGITQQYRGELPVAYVVLSNDARERLRKDPQTRITVETGIKQFIADRKVRYKHLVRVRFLDSIPRNGSGKLLRRVLRQRAREEFQTTFIQIHSKL